MSVDELVNNARGDLWETALNGNKDGYMPPGVREWLPQQRPIEFFQIDEQPHFVAVGNGRALHVEGDAGVDLQAKARVTLDKIQNGILRDGKIGYLNADDPYSNILFVTDRRILLLIGKQSGTVVGEFDYEDDAVNKITTDLVINADGIKYDYKLNFHTQDRQSAYEYMRDETSMEVEGLQPAKESGNNSVSLSELLRLSPRNFEIYIAKIWQSLGYSCKLTKKGGDSGIDVIGEGNGERILIQAKRYSNQNVGIGTVQRAAGLLVDNQFKASRVVVVTTSGFTNASKSRASQINNLKLINGQELISIINSLGDTQK